MLVSLKWLNDYVQVDDVAPEELAERITRAGIEVDSVEPLLRGMDKLVVGRVVSKEKHPEADRLNICQVDIGGEIDQIICGAPNVDAGQCVIVARPGAHLPGGIKIKKAKLRGEVSNGMICSLQELGYEGKVTPKRYADGIYVLPAGARPGDDALEYIGLDDIVLELGLTPNRSDALSLLGVAYEVGAILSRDVRLPTIEVQESARAASEALRVRVEDPRANPLYAARVVEGVRVQESPLWLQQRLMASGIRPLNNVVDITNYVLLEYGQPLHAFDAHKVATGEIATRFARGGESLVTLDGQERTLSPDQYVITDGERPIALAGVMGGQSTEVSDETTAVIIEAAYFDPATVRRSARAAALRSDSSARFEKGVDPNRVELAMDRAAQLLQQLAGGSVLSGAVCKDALDRSETSIHIRPSLVNARLGTNLTGDDMLALLGRLKIQASCEGDEIAVQAPTRRQDLAIPEDIIEEIARLYGYDRLPATLPATDGSYGRLSPYQANRRAVRRYLEGAGLLQAITYSLTSPAVVQKFQFAPAEPIRLLMPMSEERSVLRQSLIPHLLDAASYNFARQADSFAAYETGAVFKPRSDSDMPAEDEMLAIAISGRWLDAKWQGEEKQADFFVLKGIAEGLFARFGLQERVSYEATDWIEGMHPGRTARLLLDGEPFGFLGQVHPAEEKAHDLSGVYALELPLAMLLNTEVPPLSYAPIPRFPSVSRDVALVVDSAVPSAELLAVIREAGGGLLAEAHLFDVYEGARMEAGKKSLAYSLTYAQPDRTLTDEEVSAAHARILQALSERTGAQLRS